MDNDIISDYYIANQYPLKYALWMAHMKCTPNIITIKININNKLVFNQRKRIDFDLLIKNLSKEHDVDVWYYQSDNKKEFEAIICVDNTSAFNICDQILDNIILLVPEKVYKIDEKSLIEIINSSCVIEEVDLHPYFYLAVNSCETKTQRIRSNKEFCLEEQFNDDFLPVNETLSEWLLDDKCNGLAILHGIKGSGKSSYIEYLISTYCYQVKFLFITKDLIDKLLNESLVNLISLFNNKIVIFEDCEQFIRKRSDQTVNNFISILLNLSDGLLASACTSKFILTFNARVSEIDDALLRKGRCIVNYEFQELSREKTNHLLNKLGYNHVSDKGLTLAEIYNFNEQSQEPVRKKIGF